MRKLLVIAIALWAISWSSTWAQKEKFKALFIYNFTKNVEWPAQAAKMNCFTIGVLGNSAIFTELETIAQTQKALGLPIKVVNINNPQGMEYCHLLYIAPNKSAILPETLSLLNGKATLVVSDGKDLVQKGSAINFLVDGEKLKFEICKRNVDGQGLKCSTSLLNLGIPVD